jgi:hypothetical protein
LVKGGLYLNKDYTKTLFLELSSLEDHGITIWLEGSPSNPQDVASRMHINEDCAYMRDYIFDKGVLTELHFDKINQTITL